MSPGAFPKFARRPLAALGLTGLAAAAFGATQQAKAQSIDDVLGKKKLQVGILVDLPPFGVVNAKGGYEGYDVDVATLMAKYLGVDAGAGAGHRAEPHSVSADQQGGRAGGDLRHHAGARAPGAVLHPLQQHRHRADGAEGSSRSPARRISSR